METECAQITGIEYTLTINLYSKCMSSIINHFQAILVGNLLYPLGVTGLAIYMYWHYSRGLRRNGSLYLIGVNITCSRVYIHKYRLYTIPPQSVSRSNKTIGSSNNLACYTQCLKSCYQRQSAISKQTYIRHLQINSQFLFKLLVKRTIIGYPFTCPNLLEHFIKIIKIRQ